MFNEIQTRRDRGTDWTGLFEGIVDVVYRCCCGGGAATVDVKL
jgi:hypothetical protein